MTENERTIIEMIRNHKDPATAMVTAMEIILLCLKLLEPSVSIQVVGSVERA